MRLLTAITDRLSPKEMADVGTKRVRADEMKAKNKSKKPITEDRFLTYLTLRGIVDDLKLRRTGDKHGELSARRDEGQKILVEGLPYTFDPSVLQRTNKFKLTYKQKDICDLDISSLRRVALNLVAIYVIAFAQIIDTVRKTFSDHVSPQLHLYFLSLRPWISYICYIICSFHVLCRPSSTTRGQLETIVRKVV
jgi:hypothetical protein